MFALRLRPSLALAVSLLVGLACGDYSRTTSPPPVAQKLHPPTLVVSSPFSLVPRGSVAKAVKWGSTHANVDESASALIGPDGGTLSLPGASFSMTIPSGALVKPTRITIVARAGNYVVYDMLPHGLKFRQPVTAVQDLGVTASYGTSAGNLVRAAYLPDGKEQIRRDDFASPSEVQRGTTYFYGAQPIAETQEWILTHFSRYILISGAWTEVEDDPTDGGDSATSTGGSALPIGALPADTTTQQIPPLAR